MGPPFTAFIFFLSCCIFYTDAVEVKVSGYDPMNNLMNITCFLNGNTYSNSKEVQLTMNGKYLTGCNPDSCMTPADKRYKLTPSADSITITIQPINFQTDGKRWTCTLDGLSDNINLQFFPLPCSKASTGKQMSGSNPMQGGMPFSVSAIVIIVIAVIILFFVVAIFIIVVRRKNGRSTDPETTDNKGTRKQGNVKDMEIKPLISNVKDKQTNDTAAKADAELIENSVRDHKDKIKGILEDMKTTEKVAIDVFETAKEVQGLAQILLRLSKGDQVKDDDKGYVKPVDPKEALREELQGEIKKRGDLLRSMGAEYGNDLQDITPQNTQGNFTQTQTLINEAKKHMCTTKQVEGEIRDYSKGTKKVLDAVKETMDEIRPKLKNK